MTAPLSLPHRSATTDGLPSPYPNPSPTSSDSTRQGSSSGDYDIVPPYHPARTLVLCFDGTGDQFDDDVRGL